MTTSRTSSGVYRVKQIGVGVVVLLSASVWSLTLLPASAADANRGEQIFRKCVSCHTLEPNGRNRVGPRLHGLFGRLAGSVSDFSYSAALKNSGIIWDEQTLDAYLRDSEGFVPGTKMYGGLSLDEDRADLIAYLRRASARGAN